MKRANESKVAAAVLSLSSRVLCAKCYDTFSFLSARFYISVVCVVRHADSALFLKPYTLNNKKIWVWFFFSSATSFSSLSSWGGTPPERHDAVSVLK